jgi:hypothetical protein
MRDLSYLPISAALTAGVLAMATACSRPPALTPAAPLTPAAAEVETVSRVGFNQPENLVYDSVADVFLVSNMGGGDTAHDDNGFISRVAPDGRILTLKWIAGGRYGAVLHAPKGLAIRGDTLAVADLGAVRLFDRRTGAPLLSITLPGLMMNDVAFAPDGSLWITDTGPSRTPAPVDTTKDLDAVWRVTRDRKVETIARGLGLGRPDGLVLDGSAALITTFGGRRIEQTPAAPPNQWTTVATLPAGRLDGLRRLPDGSLVVTSWDARMVWRLDNAHVAHPLLTGVTSPAGVAVDTRRDRLAVTSMQDNAMYLLSLRK